MLNTRLSQDGRSSPPMNHRHDVVVLDHFEAGLEYEPELEHDRTRTDLKGDNSFAAVSMLPETIAAVRRQRIVIPASRFA